MFRNERDVTISGGTFTQVVEGLNGRQMLSQSRYVMHGAIHDSGQRYPPSECHPGTREDVLNMVRNWVDKPLDESKSQILWISGPAGVGKTALAQSICQLLKELGRLGGDFFLSRSVAGHNDLHTLFPTIAYQLAEMHPEYAHELDASIKAQESILTKNIELQIEHLIVNPLKRMDNKLDTPLILVIDGLDEVGTERDHILLLRVLGSNFLSQRLPLKLILASRPEPWIKRAFDDTPLLGNSQCHFLHHTSQTDNDIRIVLNSGFAKIQKTHDLMKNHSDTWPSDKVVDDIINRASGQFIYASTILRYVEDPDGDPIDRLQKIVEISSKGSHKHTDSPFLALDTLYKNILSTSSSIDHTLAILGVVVAINLQSNVDFPPLSQIERIFKFRPGYSFLALRTIQSLVNVSSNDKHSIKFYHKSFQDFLLDPDRSGKCFIDINQVNTWLATMAIRSFAQSPSGPELERSNQWEIKHWTIWWLCSAASDENRLLTEVKAIYPISFYLNYAAIIALKVVFWPLNALPSQAEPVASYCRDGNIAKSMSLWTTRASTLTVERLEAVTIVLNKHFRTSAKAPHQSLTRLILNRPLSLVLVGTLGPLGPLGLLGLLVFLGLLRFLGVLDPIGPINLASFLGLLGLLRLLSFTKSQLLSALHAASFFGRMDLMDFTGFLDLLRLLSFTQSGFIYSLGLGFALTFIYTLNLLRLVVFIYLIYVLCVLYSQYKSITDYLSLKGLLLEGLVIALIFLFTLCLVGLASLIRLAGLASFLGLLYLQDAISTPALLGFLYLLGSTGPLYVVGFPRFLIFLYLFLKNTSVL